MTNDGHFFSRVWDVVRLIPPGRVSSYGAIARFLGTGQSARMVGWAMNASASSKEYVPAHRVVNRIGMLTGKHFFDTADEMEKLLNAEGISVSEDLIQEFDKVFWDPAKELGTPDE